MRNSGTLRLNKALTLKLLFMYLLAQHSCFLKKAKSYKNCEKFLSNVSSLIFFCRVCSPFSSRGISHNILANFHILVVFSRSGTFIRSRKSVYNLR